MRSPVREPRAWRAPFVVATALAVAANLALLWGFAHVPAQDHMNHVASLRVLRGLWEGDPFYAARFTVARGLVPDLLSEAVWFAALRPLGELAASKVILSLYMAGMPLAWWAFLRRYCAANTTLLPLAPLVTLNAYYGLGSTNFLLGLPLFLAGCAAWDGVRERGTGLARFALLAALTWLAHVYDYLFLGAFVAAHAAVGMLSGRRPAAREAVAASGLLAGLAAAARCVFAATPEWAASAPPRFDLHPRGVLRVLELSARLRHGGTRYVGLALLVVVCATLFDALRDRSPRAWRGAMHPVVGAAAALLFAALWLCPAGVGTEASIKERFAVPCLLLATAAFVPPRRAAPRALALAALCAALALKWNDQRLLHARFERRASAAMGSLVPRIPRHARVLSVFWWRGRGVAETIFVHFPDVAVVARDAFVPDLFDAPGQQILRYRGRRRDASLAGPAALVPASLAGFDYVWAQSDDPDALLANVRGCLEAVAAEGPDLLLRVRAACAVVSATRD